MCKKVLFLILALLMVCSLAACGKDTQEDTKPTLNPGDPNCQHSWTDWEVTKEETCSKNGRMKHACTSCNKEEEETILAWGHIYMGGQCVDCQKEPKDCEHKEVYELKISEADCDDDGETRDICKKCKAVVHRYITSAYWHPEWDVVRITEPTCNEYGVEHLVCKLCQEVIGQNVIEPNGHDYLYVDEQLPTCTENGWASYKLCTTCGYQYNYYEYQATGHDFCVDSCLNCGEVDPTFEMQDAPSYRDNSLVVEQTAPNPFHVEPAQVDRFTGDISTGEVWTFHASVDGDYMLWLNKLEAGAYVQVELFDSNGQRVAYASELYSDDCMFVELTQGDYTVKVSYGNAPTTYNLSICHPKTTVDISGQYVICDQMQYHGQSITYTYTAETAGMYYFSLSDMTDWVYMELLDAYENLLDIREYATSGSSMVAYLEAGETCTFYFANSYGVYGNFTLNISTQRPSLDITGYTSVVDRIRYEMEQVTYTFTANATYYSIAVLNLTDNAYVSLYMYGPEGDLLYNSYWCPEGSSFYYDAFEVGQTYTIVVEYNYKTTDYTLFLLPQREPVVLQSDMGIRDELLNSNQTNIYHFAADREGSHRLMLDIRSGESYDVVNVMIFDAYGNYVCNHWLYDGQYVNLGYLLVGESFTIYISQNVGQMQYAIAMRE